ncbi:MAG: YafY family protein [Pseudolysinimonas sp.]
MMETSVRLLRLLALLQMRRDWSGQDLADRLDVTTRTVRRDIDKLREMDYPVYAAKGIAGGYRLGAGTQLPPLILDDDETVAVAIALRTATASSVAGIGENALRALIKLEQVLPSRLRGRVSAVQVTQVHSPDFGIEVDAAVLTAVGAASRDQLSVRFTYRGHDGAESEREVEPHELVAWGPRWYLVAWDPSNDDWRTFRVDRIGSNVRVGRRFVRHDIPNGDAAAFVTRGIASVWPFQATIRLHAGADSQVARDVGIYGRIEPINANTCLLHAGADNAVSMAFNLSGVGVDFEVVDSPELAAQILLLAERFRRAGSAQG